MAYCRFGSESDVYLFRSLHSTKGIDSWTCCGCIMNIGGGDTVHYTRADAVRHLLDHLLQGHMVPVDAVARLWGEIADEARLSPPFVG